jgi:hypothetical protein
LASVNALKAISCFVEVFSGFAGALDLQIKEERKIRDEDSHREPTQSPLSPICFLSSLLIS